MKRTGLAVVVVALLIAALTPAVRVHAQAADPQYAEAKRLFDALDYENALKALDGAIAALEARPITDPTRRDLLASAYEMRSRSKFGLGDPDGAKADFVALLKVNPAYALTGQVSPRVVTLFEDSVKETVTTLNLTVTPATAKVDIDGIPVTTVNGTIPVVVGDHVVSADQPGYRKGQQALTVALGVPATVSLTLERVSSMVSIRTAPFDVDVAIDGVKRGKTAAGAPGAAAPVSAAMVITDLQPGAHVIELTRECYVTAQQRVTIDKPDDYTVGPVTLQHAVASLSVTANEPGAQVLVDGQARGTAPFTTPDLCEGEHLVELRAPVGRYSKRVQARTGDKISVDGTIKPAFVMVSAAGQAAGAPDLRLVVERAFDPAQSVTFFAPPIEQVDQALKANQLQPGWLSFDTNKRPVGVAADVLQPARRDASTKLAGLFGAQGVAGVTLVDRNHIIVSLLAAGSSEPDVLDVSLDIPESVAKVIGQLDRVPSFSQPAIGLTTIDVADVAGAVVIGVDASSPAASAGIKAGDIVTKADGQAVENVGGLVGLLAKHKANDDLALEIKDKAGVKPATVKVFMTPRLISIADQTLLVNQLLLSLRVRLLTQKDPADEAVLRLNLAAALGHVEAWTDARAELQRVKLPDGGGVSNGTVQYLMGLAAEKLGNRADAETAFKAAAASEGLLTEDGPAVKDLAEAKLADLQRRPGSAP